jgi:hypothetical protein
MVEFEPQQGIVQISIQFLPGAVSPAVRGEKLEADHSYENSASVTNMWKVMTPSSTCLSGAGANSSLFYR